MAKTSLIGAINRDPLHSTAKGIAIPYGIYDTQANRGSVFLGISHDISAFAVSCLRKWWLLEGRKRYPQSNHILILADTGGSNGARRSAFQQEIQCQLCDSLGLKVTFTLPFRGLQMESHRAPPVQPDQQELGSRAAGQL